VNKLKIKNELPYSMRMVKYLRIKSDTFDMLEHNTGLSIFGKAFHFFMIILIILNVVAVMAETVQNFEDNYSVLFDDFEIFSVTIFTGEYFLRLWSCNIHNKYKGHLWGRIRFLIAPMSVIDLIAIVPFYLPLLLPIDLRFLRVLRLFRIFRIFKLGRYSDAYRLISRVVREKAEYLGVSMVFVLSLLIIASSIMYYIEHDAQPETFSSIPATMWWAVITLTTVGYGDIYPITPLGKILSGFIAFLGIGLFALPAGILASGFSEELNREKSCPIYCPHCGKEIK